MDDKILIVPDVHGRTFWRDVIDSDLQVVFLGDYLDPYPHENITPDMALSEFKEIIKFAKMEPDRVTLLLGNHMLHYVGLSPDVCRLDWNNRKEIYNLLKENQCLFQHAFKWNNTLFTHAGVTEGWLKQSGYTNNPELISDQLNRNIQFTDEYIINPHWDMDCLQDPRGDIGRSRGGYAPYGGPNWADLTETYNGSAFKDSLIQIFGHTQLEVTGSFYHKDNFYCCDSRSIFIWDGKDLKPYNKNENL